MSVVATVKVYDGIVLGAESMTQLIATINGQPQLIKSYENAQKLFEVGGPEGGLPIGILTYGIGNIGRRSIESFVREFSRSEPHGEDQAIEVEQTARRFYTFMKNHYDQAFGAVPIEQRPAMGFMVAGYSDGQHLASEWEFVLPLNAEPIPARGQNDVGASWRGVGAPFTRLMFGCDPTLEHQLQQAGASQEELDRLRSVLPGLATNVAFDGMPLQDAIGYCRFVIQTTIGWCAYALGAAACGGPIKMATITPGSGFDWITPPKQYVGGEKHGH